MEKPIVFLSHSSKNKRELIALKELLDRKAVSSIEFFLSSDGESIPLGTSWHDRIVNALKRAKLMFVFISPESVTSGWVYFEAGFAVSKGIRVIPVCLPGIDINRLPPPLNLLLQAHELHSFKGLNRLLAECNRDFQTRIPESCTKDDFGSVFGKPKEGSVKPFVEWERLVERLLVTTTVRVGDAIQEMINVCKRNNLDAVASEIDWDWGNTARGVLAPGLEMALEPCSRNKPFEGQSGEVKEEDKERSVRFTLSPKLFHTTSSLIDEWAALRRAAPGFDLVVRLPVNVVLEPEPHRLTTKIHGSDVRMVDAGAFEAFGTRFCLSKQRYGSAIDFSVEVNCPLAKLPLRELVALLFELSVLSVDKSIRIR